MTRRSSILDSRGNPIQRSAATSPRRNVTGRYDAAQTTDEMRRHWSEADHLSARAANAPDVRFKLRNRSRYEAANNCYANGIVQTLANDVVGTGPHLQLLTEDADLNRTIEHEFCEWSEAIGLPEKLRTMRRARAVDGEAFGILATNPKLTTDVQLDMRLIEADQFATPFPYPLDEYSVDGIAFDRYWNPIEYHCLRVHPGDAIAFAPAYEFDRLPADSVIHWFRADRPQQYRGIPDLTPAINLFAQLRRYTLAVLAAAETAADFAAILFSEMPPDGEADSADPFESLEIERRMMTTLPAGWKMAQFKAEQPATTYEMFKREILNEIARCVLMPYNVAAGNSSSYNYSSGKLDHQVYYRMVAVDQSHLSRIALDPLLAAWLEEAALAGLIDRSMATLDEWPHRWLWPEPAHVDPEKEANAQEILLRNLMTTFSDECQKQGVDPESRAQTIASDLALLKKHGIPLPAAWAQPTPPKPGGSNAADTQSDPSQSQQNGNAYEGRFYRNGFARP